jgi:hypothetical protein
MTDAWKESVRNWLKETKTERQELARRVGIDKSMISKMLSESKPIYASAHVLDVCRETGLPPPVIAFGDELVQRLLEWAYSARADNREEFERLVSLLADDAAASKARADSRKKTESAIMQKPSDSRHSRR